MHAARLGCVMTVTDRAVYQHANTRTLRPCHTQMLSRDRSPFSLDGTQTVLVSASVHRDDTGETNSVCRRGKVSSWSPESWLALDWPFPTFHALKRRLTASNKLYITSLFATTKLQHDKKTKQAKISNKHTYKVNRV